MTFTKVNAIDSATAVDVLSDVYEVPGAVRFGLQATGTATSYAVTLEGSIDGVNWRGLFSASNTSPLTGYGAGVGARSTATGFSVNIAIVKCIRLRVASVNGGNVSAHLVAT